MIHEPSARVWRWSPGRATIGRVCLAVGLVGCAASDASPPRREERLLPARYTTGRLFRQRWRACRLTGADSVVPRYRCAEPLRPGTDDFVAISEFAKQTRGATTDHSSTALRSNALVDLRSFVENPRALDRAVAFLDRARREAPNDPAVLNDLAVAYLQVAERDQQLMPMLRALDAADAALQREPTQLSALFNRALILDRLHLIATADGAWRTYIGAETDPAWKDEARSFARSLAARVDTLTPRDFPQRARERMFALIGELGKAELARDAASAARLVAEWRGLGDSLPGAPADRTVRLAFEWFDRLPPAARASAASSLVALSAGIYFHDHAGHERAVREIEHATTTLAALRSPLEPWAAFYRAAAETNLARYGVAENRLLRLLARSTRDQPGVTGKALWVLGVIRSRTGRLESGSRAYHQARDHLSMAQDGKNVAAVSFLLAESLAREGDELGSLAEGFRGLRDLARFRQSYYLHGHLIAIAGAARAAGLRHAALDVASEALEVNTTLKQPDALVRARCTRARDFAEIGDTTRALAEVDAAFTTAAAIPDRSGELARAEVAFTRGRLLRHRDWPSAVRLLSDALAVYQHAGLPNRLAAVLYELALGAEKVGDRALAQTRLREAIEIIEHQRASITAAEGRAAFDETIENVFDAMIRVALDAGQSDTAFQYLERERAAVWSGVSRDTTVAVVDGGSRSPSEIASQLPADMALIAYAVLPDRVAIWVGRHGESYAVSVPVKRDSLTTLASRLMENGSTNEDAASARAKLFDVLIAPIAHRLAGARRLAVVPDRELTTVSFAALFDSRTGRFMIEDYGILTEPSAAYLVHARSVGAGRAKWGTPSALVVGDPSLGRNDVLARGALPGAGSEARQVAALYSTRALLLGRDADRNAVLARLPRHTLFHFAGHAVFNPDRPELSYLALAADSSTYGGRLAAREIATMRLSNLRLVVLSACRSLSSRPSRTGPVAGLAFSFLRAGVSATVSTLWDVTDEATGDLLVEFHRQLRAGMEAPEALRLAQLDAVRSTNARLRSPAVWAAFIYTGY